LAIPLATAAACDITENGGNGMGFPAKSLPQQIPGVWPNEIGFRSEPQWRGGFREIDIK